MNVFKKKTGRDMAGYLLLAVSVFLLGRSFTLCFSNDIWYDELFTVGMAEHSYGELIRFTAADVHPPLYYCIVKLFVDLCKLIVPGAGTVIPAKIVSILPYIILLLYGLWFIRKRFGVFVCGLFLFCAIAMPQLPAYTVEVRMYGWAMLFVTAAFLHAYALVKDGRLMGACGEEAVQPGAEHTGGPRDRRESGRKAQLIHGAALTLYGLAAAYTQYFAAVAVGMVYLCVLIVFIKKDRSRIREWLLGVGISAAGYLPWLFVLYRQIAAVRENYWILPLSWRSLGGCVKFLMKPAFRDDRLNVVLAVVLFAAFAAVWGYQALELYYNSREKKKNTEIQSPRSKPQSSKFAGGNEGEIGREIWETGKAGQAERFWLATAGIGVLAGLVLFGFAASILIRPIFVYRYMIPALGCFWFSFALGVDDILCKPVKPETAQNEKKSQRPHGNKKSWQFETEIRTDPEKGRESEVPISAGKKQMSLSGRTRIRNTEKNRIVYLAGIALTILVFLIGLRDYRAFTGEEEYKAVSMRETEAALSLIGQQDAVIYNFDQVQAVTSYYLPGTVERFLWRTEGEKLIQKITSPCGRIEDVGEMEAMLEALMPEGGSLWFIGSFNSRDDIVAQWREAGLEVEEKGSFLLERYWFNLYRIS